MPLTPQDVRNKLFTSVRLRPGYDEDEVDAFLDEVEQELARLHARIDELSGADRGPDDDRPSAVRRDADAQHLAELAAARQDHDAELAAARAEVDDRVRREVAAATAQTETARQQADAVRQQAEARLAQAAQQAQAQAQQLQHLEAQLAQAHAQLEEVQRQLVAARQAPAPPTDGGSYLAPAAAPSAPAPLPPPSPTEDALRRTLLLAQRTADEAVAEARAEAQRIVGDAQRQVHETTRRAEAEHVAAMSRARADYETLATKLEELRGFERDYRSRLRAYLHLQLRDLDAGAPEPPPAVAAPPRNALTDGGSGAAAPSAAPSDGDAPPYVPASADDGSVGVDAR